MSLIPQRYKLFCYVQYYALYIYTYLLLYIKYIPSPPLWLFIYYRRASPHPPLLYSPPGRVQRASARPTSAKSATQEPCFNFPTKLPSVPP